MALAETTELTEARSMARAADAERKENGGSTGPVSVAEAVGAAAEMRPATAEQGPLLTQTPAAPPEHKDKTVQSVSYQTRYLIT